MIPSIAVVSTVVIIVILSIVAISSSSAKVESNVEEASHHEGSDNNASVGDDQADILELDLAPCLCILQLLALNTLENDQQQSKTAHSNLQQDIIIHCIYHL